MSELDAIARRSRADPEDRELWFAWTHGARREAWKREGYELDVLVEALVRGSVAQRKAAAEMLEDLGPLIIPALFPMLRGGKAKERERALAAIVERAPAKLVELELVMVALEEGSRKASDKALAHISQLTKLSPEALERALQALESADDLQRRRAVDLLEQRRSQAAEILPRLRSIIDNPLGATRVHALRVFAELAPPQELAAVLQEGLSDPDDFFAQQCYRTIEFRGLENAVDLEGAFLAAVRADLDEAKQSAETIARLGRGSLDHAIALAEREKAPAFLAALALKSPRALEALVALHRGDAELREACREAAKHFGLGSKLEAALKREG